MNSTVARAAAALAVSSALAVGTAGAAGAATPAPAHVVTTAAQSSTSTASHPKARAWLRAHRRQIRRAVVEISAKTIDVPASTLVSDLRSGQSIAEVATAHGVSPQTVVDALVSAGDNWVDRAVSDHRLTTAQADKIKALLPTAATKVVDHQFVAKTGTSTSTGAAQAVA